MSDGGEPVVDWDEKAEDHAVAHHTYEHLRETENDRLYDMFVKGARWQRRKLNAESVVDRLAAFLFEDDRGESMESHEQTCTQTDCHLRDTYTSYAGAVLSVVVGEQDGSGRSSGKVVGES